MSYHMTIDIPEQKIGAYSIRHRLIPAAQPVMTSTTRTRS